MDQKIQAAVAQACKAVAVAVEPSRRSYSDQSKTVNIARTERGGRRSASILVGLAGPSSLARFFERLAVLRASLLCKSPGLPFLILWEIHIFPMLNLGTNMQGVLGTLPAETEDLVPTSLSSGPH